MTVPSSGNATTAASPEARQSLQPVALEWLETRGISAELAAKFQLLVDALNEVSEMAHTHTDQDILRLYEIWMKTGSPRAYNILRRLGVAPVPAGARSEH